MSLLSFISSRVDFQLHVPWAVFVFLFGACVGSFLNVVIYRLPAGMSVTTPPSRCPTCGARLRFFRENLPILGWFMVRGRCRYCGVKISPQYMVIELLMALIFLGLYLTLFAVPPRTPWWSEIGGPWWHYSSFLRLPFPAGAWPVYFAWAFLLAGLVAMTVIDARTFTIPMPIPLFVTFAAFIAYFIESLMPQRTIAAQSWPIPALCWPGTLTAMGGMLGVLISSILLKFGVLRYSFADYAQYLTPAPQAEAELQAQGGGDRIWGNPANLESAPRAPVSRSCCFCCHASLGWWPARHSVCGLG